MRDRYDDQHASEFGDCGNDDGGMASENQWHLRVVAGILEPSAGRGNGHMGKDHILVLNHQDCSIVHFKMIMNMVIEHQRRVILRSIWVQHDHRLVNEA